MQASNDVTVVSNAGATTPADTFKELHFAENKKDANTLSKWARWKSQDRVEETSASTF
jgi:hypothetical protein